MAKTHLGLRLPVKPPRLPSNIERRNQSRHRSRSNPAVNLHTCSCAESPLKGSRGILVEFSTVTYAKKHICRWPENCVGRTAFQICNEFFCCLTAATIATWLANTNPAPHPAPHTWGSKEPWKCARRKYCANCGKQWKRAGKWGNVPCICNWLLLWLIVLLCFPLFNKCTVTLDLFLLRILSNCGFILFSRAEVFKSYIFVLVLIGIH